MGAEAQYAAWYWTETTIDGEGEGAVGWHPCFSLPENRTVVVGRARRRVVSGGSGRGSRRASGSTSGGLLRVPE